MITVWIGLVVAGAIGAPCRYLVDVLVREHSAESFPWGTMVVNLSGSFALGLVTGAALYHAFPSTPRVIIGTGFIGAYTTFSTWTFETVRLLEEGAPTRAVANAVVSVVLGLGAAAAGLAVASL